jgi:alpha-1,6-mannosyltransferase
VLGLSTATVLALGLVSGLGTGWIRGLSTPLSHRSLLSPSTELGLHVGALLGLHLVTFAHLLAALLLVAVVAYVVLHAPAESAADVVLGAAVVMSAAVLLSPVVHYWYFFWCLPFLACAALPRRFQRATVAMTLVLGLLAPFELTRHHLPFSKTMMVLGISAALLTLLDPRDLSRLVSRTRREHE